MARIAVGISGGGYRATAWGLGVLWCLADTGLNADVTMVSSVSGGSLTNAHAGWLATPYDAMPAAEYDAAAASLAGRLAGSPGGFGAALKVTVLAGLAAWVSVGFGWAPGVLAALAVALVAAVLGTLKSGDLLFDRFEIWLYVDGLLALVGLMVWAWPHPWLVLLALLGVATYALLRGPVVGWCMAASLKTLTGRGNTTLGGLNAAPMHVILSTELHAGHHMCFARDFVYSYDIGLGAKPSLPVRTAVQASANLPGAFPTRWLRTAGMGLVGGADTPAFLALTDGGVYDNMADQWPIGLAARLKRWNDTPAIVDDPARKAVVDQVAAAAPDLVVVANASGSLGWRKVGRAAIPLVGELLGLLQVKDVLYDNGTSVRREWIVGRFDLGTPDGTLIHIATNPFKYPKWVLATSTDATIRQRATEALAYLAGLGVSENEWTARMTAARGVGTQLWPLGTAATRNLVQAAYVQTAVNLHVRTGAALPPPPSL